MSFYRSCVKTTEEKHGRLSRSLHDEASMTLTLRDFDLPEV